jgi:Sulfotransferase family
MRGDFLAAASTATGLTDFGDDDFSPGLDLFLDCLDRETLLSDGGRDMTMGQIKMFLTSRLHSEQGWKSRPDALRHPISAPLIITGIVRSGTTALHKLLSMDPQFQGLEHWLTRAPQVRPPRETWATNPAYRQAAGVVDAMIDGAPEMRVDHMMSAAEVEESIFLLPQTFVCNMFPSQWNIPTYDAWYREQDETPSYARFAKNLQLIGANAPDRRWLLKNPTDLFAMGAVLNVFPDAMIVQTHRDPLQAVPSVTNLIAAARRLFEGAQSDPAAVGKRETEFWALALARAAEARGRTRIPVFDVEFSDIIRDLLGVVQAIYTHFGLTLTQVGEAAMRDWLAGHPRQSVTLHRFAPEDFGLATGKLLELYEGYRVLRGYA